MASPTMKISVHRPSYAHTPTSQLNQHSHDHGHDHSLEHGHSHEHLEHPGRYEEREAPVYTGRDWKERTFTVGIGGPVGSGKTALMLALCRALHPTYIIGAVTNDIFTREDAEFLVRHNALPQDRIRAIETGGCPHAAIREDISANLNALEELQALFGCQLLLVESGGDNLAGTFLPRLGLFNVVDDVSILPRNMLAMEVNVVPTRSFSFPANYSRELADYIIYVIDVSGGDKIPRKGGPGITQSDLLVINKTDLAQAVGADLEVMRRDADKMREGGPVVFSQVKHGVGVQDIVDRILDAWRGSGAAK
ncbi:hypothetical protein HK104_006818 [Borealophlyctis nickersoniae]|nr:hypothetical protein HK104_006818 [Borealophlyctis nickersoniae]